MDNGFILRAEQHYPDGRIIYLPAVHNRLQASFNIAKAGLISNKDSGFIKYVEVGSGVPSWDASPPAPDPGTANTALIAPISRVGPYTSTDWSYLDGSGNITGTPTGSVQLTSTLSVGVGNGTLREAAMWSGSAASGTIGTGLLVNVVRFVGIAKPSGGSDYSLVLKLFITFS